MLTEKIQQLENMRTNVAVNCNMRREVSLVLVHHKNHTACYWPGMCTTEFLVFLRSRVRGDHDRNVVVCTRNCLKTAIKHCLLPPVSSQWQLAG